MRTIPACNAVRRGLLHIIDFSRSAVIVRSAFAAFTHRGFGRFEKIYRKHCKMASFCTIRGTKASFLGGHELLFVHCVSKQPLLLISEGLPCVQLECREVHVSFTDSLTIRRIVLCPSVVNGIKIDEMFADCGSPALVQIHSSCVFKVR